jgi:hypothetical protein
MTSPVIVANTIEWIFPGILIALFGVLAILNAILFVGRYIMHPPRTPSLVPFVGGLAGAYGFYDAPPPQLHHIAWVPLFADVGCIPLILFAFWKTFRERRQLRKDK